MKAALLVLAVISICSGDSDHGEVAPLLTADNFDDEVSKEPHFIMFFAPWCGHCKRLAPTWDKLAEKLNPVDEVTMARVDCTDQTKLCAKFDVKGYPTLRFFNKDTTTSTQYRGQRDEDTLEKFINEQLHGSKEQPKKEDDSAKKERPESDTVDGLTELTKDTFAKHIEKGHHFIKFYAPWCGHCKKLAPTWKDLAKHYEAKEGISVSKVDCTQYRETCSTYDVAGYPTLLFFTDGQKVEKYSGARDLAALKNFVDSKSAGEDKKKTETHEKIPDPVPEDQEPSHVSLLSEESFKDGIAKGTTFVKFFAPWCGHCKRLAPTWDDLGKEYADNKNVNIAKVDCTTDRPVCSEHGVRGFPTLILFRDGEKVADYSGSRDQHSLSRFIRDKVPHDEL